MEHLTITLYWKGLPRSMKTIGTFIVDESELELLEGHYGNDLSIDVWDATNIKRKYTFVDVLRTIDESASKIFGLQICRELISQLS